MEQEIKALKELYNSMQLRASSQADLISNIVKTDDLDTNVDAMTRDKTVASIVTRLDKIETKVEGIMPLEKQSIIKYLVDQANNAERTLTAHSRNIQQICNKLNDQIDKKEATDEANGQELKQKLEQLAHEVKNVNHTLDKLQTATHEQYRTLLPTVEKVNELDGCIEELAGIIEDLASYHMAYVDSEESAAKAAATSDSPGEKEPVQEESDACSLKCSVQGEEIKESQVTSAKAHTKHRRDSKKKK